MSFQTGFNHASYRFDNIFINPCPESPPQGFGQNCRILAAPFLDGFQSVLYVLTMSFQSMRDAKPSPQGFGQTMPNPRRPVLKYRQSFWGSGLFGVLCGVRGWFWGLFGELALGKGVFRRLFEGLFWARGLLRGLSGGLFWGRELFKGLSGGLFWGRGLFRGLLGGWFWGRGL